MSGVVPLSVRRPHDVVRDCFVVYASSAPRRDFVIKDFVRGFVEGATPKSIPAEDRRRSVKRWSEEVNPAFANSPNLILRRTVGRHRYKLVPFILKTQPATQSAEPLQPIQGSAECGPAVSSE